MRREISTEKGMQTKLPRCPFSKEHYTCIGWNRDPNATTSEVNIGPDGTARITVDEDTTLYAIWKQTSFQVIFDPCEGESSFSEKYVDFESTISTLPEVWRDGYIFNGWFTDPLYGSQVDSQTIVSHDMKLYARWTEQTYTLVFSANGGVGTMDNRILSYSETSRLNGTFTREGYVFTGWNTQSDGKGTTYANGAEVTGLCDVNCGTVCLYAQWKAEGSSPTPDPEPPPQPPVVLFDEQNLTPLGNTNPVTVYIRYLSWGGDDGHRGVPGMKHLYNCERVSCSTYTGRCRADVYKHNDQQYNEAIYYKVKILPCRDMRNDNSDYIFFNLPIYQYKGKTLVWMLQKMGKAKYATSAESDQVETEVNEGWTPIRNAYKGTSQDSYKYKDVYIRASYFGTLTGLSTHDGKGTGIVLWPIKEPFEDPS